MPAASGYQGSFTFGNDDLSHEARPEVPASGKPTKKPRNRKKPKPSSAPPDSSMAHGEYTVTSLNQVRFSHSSVYRLHTIVRKKKAIPNIPLGWSIDRRVYRETLWNIHPQWHCRLDDFAIWREIDNDLLDARYEFGVRVIRRLYDELFILSHWHRYNVVLSKIGGWGAATLF